MSRTSLSQTLIAREQRMLYCNHGPRDYHRRPVHPYRRGCWEVQACRGGNIHPTFPGRTGDGGQDRLWLFMPECLHGWSAPPSSGAEIVVLHCQDLPEAVGALAAATGWWSHSLPPGAWKQLRNLEQQTARHLRRIDSRARLHCERIRLELACLLLDLAPELHLPPPDPAAAVVERARAWYAAQLDRAPDLRALAAAVDYSPAHLRRLFHRACGRSPRAECERIRMQRAAMLLADGHGCGVVARACGFTGVAAFSKAFRRYHGRPPSAQWPAT